MTTTTRNTYGADVDNLTARIKDASDKATEKLVELKDTAKQSVEKAGERMIELKDTAKQSIGARVDTLGNAIQKHPIRFGLGALAIGYLYARIRH